jgi:hypothetical protein
MNFEYQPRTAYDVEQRIGQDREGGRVPKADSETQCETCRHPKLFHCQKYRKTERPRGFLWAFDYQRPRLRFPVKCKHADALRPFEPPLCNSSACSVADCGCVGFASPFRKPKKAPTAKKTSAPRRKRPTKAKAAQQQDCPALSAGEAGTC